MSRIKSSQRELADQYQVSQPILARLKKNGIDIHNREAVRAALLSQKKRPKAWSNGCPWDEKPELEPVDYDKLKTIELKSSLDDIIDQLKRGDLVWDEVKTLKARIDGMEKAIKIRVIMCELVPSDDVESDGMRIGHAMGSALKSLPHEMSAVCEGLPAAEMKKKLSDKCHSIMTMLSDETGDVYDQSN